MYVTNYTSNLNKKVNYSRARDYIHQLFHDTICENIYENLDMEIYKQIDQYNNLFKLSKNLY